VKVPKPSFAEVLDLAHGCGAWAALAHPGYYGWPEAELESRLGRLARLGMDGVEVEYPYHTVSPHRFSEADEAALVARLREIATGLGLRVTRGSDAHTIADLDRIYGARAPSPRPYEPRSETE